MLKIQAEANIPTDFGVFKMIAFSDNEMDWTPHIALIAENTDFSKEVNVRFHSECITGEIFHSKKCECGQQLDAAMQYMQKNGGIILYLRQEGRNIGIINKLKAYALQEQGMDTVQANLHLGLPADGRDFGVAIDILTNLGVKEINLLTNNPDKLKFVEDSTIKLNERIPLQIPSNEVNEDYLKVKKTYFGHLLEDNK
ncbi:GTP cyclohydrolase II [Riemerella anatipestifer]|uniref:GTP cyclohydrolase-2 n=1 Tax=Riemerella anatipestifer TaxID=34085 RepID=A0A1S7DT66_RIEAN|nr:GTP cyclohydrolase II [Riemerella anatipestifer]AQY22297.1 Riboflavin biosynthesis protein RibBA [Riemerella anatipestifer]MBO4233702.1 GTP cyclohydrolase II [Riemerella anatipestifer]MCO4304514.1 GTP cyclohydrolase II [Riemerella anatipestifer]MCO7353287.1 GTP cyclohydrolase II [Riemerella anatipestifer]MCQ4039881.1 GTP cyclohydrolase II [Riemerella anatipestifer]